MSLFNIKDEDSWRELFCSTQKKLDEATQTLFNKDLKCLKLGRQIVTLEEDIKTLLNIIVNHREMTEEEKDYFAEEYQEYFVKNIVRKSLDSKEK